MYPLGRLEDLGAALERMFPVEQSSAKTDFSCFSDPGVKVLADTRRGVATYVPWEANVLVPDDPNVNSAAVARRVLILLL